MSIEKPNKNNPASSLGMLRVTSAVNPNAIKAALSFAPAAKASFIRVAARPVARVWPVMMIGVPFEFVRGYVGTRRDPLLQFSKFVALDIFRGYVGSRRDPLLQLKT